MGNPVLGDGAEARSTCRERIGNGVPAVNSIGDDKFADWGSNLSIEPWLSWLKDDMKYLCPAHTPHDGQGA